MIGGVNDVTGAQPRAVIPAPKNQNTAGAASPTSKPVEAGLSVFKDHYHTGPTVQEKVGGALGGSQTVRSGGGPIATAGGGAPIAAVGSGGDVAARGGAALESVEPGRDLGALGRVDDASSPPPNPNNWQVEKTNEPPKLYIPREVWFTPDGPESGAFFGYTQQQMDNTREAAKLALYLGGKPSGIDNLQKELAGLPPNKFEGPWKDLTRVHYSSDIPNASPDQVGQRVLDDPAGFFSGNGQSGLNVRAMYDHETGQAASRIQVGRTYDVLLADNRAPGVPFAVPLPVRLTANYLDIGDDGRNGPLQLSVQTLLAHGLNGTQSWTFEDDGNGGTHIDQYGVFQLSNPAAGGLDPSKIEARQTEVWRLAHLGLYNDFPPVSDPIPPRRLVA